jgi:hypothetical protein
MRALESILLGTICGRERGCEKTVEYYVRMNFVMFAADPVALGRTGHAARVRLNNKLILSCLANISKFGPWMGG